MYTHPGKTKFKNSDINSKANVFQQIVKKQQNPVKHEKQMLNWPAFQYLDSSIKVHTCVHSKSSKTHNKNNSREDIMMKRQKQAISIVLLVYTLPIYSYTDPVTVNAKPVGYN